MSGHSPIGLIRLTTVAFASLFSTQVFATEATAELSPLKSVYVFSVNAGHRTADVIDDNEVIHDYAEHLKDGLSLSFTGGGFVNPTWGAGVNLSRFGTSHSDSRITVSDGVQTFTGASDDISMWFIGPVLLQQIGFSGNKGLALFEVGMGFLTYGNDSKIGNLKLEFSGNTLGFTTSVLIALRTQKNFLLGLRGGFVVGSIGEMEVNGNNVKLPKKESLTRFEFGFSLGFGT